MSTAPSAELPGRESHEVLLRESLTDVGNGRRLVSRHGVDLRHAPSLGGWLIWDGRRWARDDSGEIERRAKETARAMYGVVTRIKDTTKRGQFARWAVRSEDAARIAAMIRLGETEPGVRVGAGELDRDPWALCVMNGVINLRTGELRPHQRDDLMTKLAPVEYHADAECPTWDGFIKTITAGDAALGGYLQRAIGYALTGDTSEHCLFVLHGGGANGKSTFLNAVRSVLDDYARQTATETLLRRHGQAVNNDVARLQGARFVTAAEIEGGRKFDEALIKQITGGDPVSARYLYREHFEFVPAFKIFFAVNHLPRVDGTDQGIWRRMRLIPFTVTIPDDKQDRQLPVRLAGELPGILRWAVEGCLDWQRAGLKTPDAVTAATSGYRDEMDVVGDFIAECCVVDPAATVPSATLYSAYEVWCAGDGERAVSKQEFGMRLGERGCTPCRVNKVRAWRGLALTDPVTR